MENISWEDAIETARKTLEDAECERKKCADREASSCCCDDSDCCGNSGCYI